MFTKGDVVQDVNGNLYTVDEYTVDEYSNIFERVFCWKDGKCYDLNPDDIELYDAEFSLYDLLDNVKDALEGIDSNEQYCVSLDRRIEKVEQDISQLKKVVGDIANYCINNSLKKGY